MDIQELALPSVFNTLSVENLINKPSKVSQKIAARQIYLTTALLEGKEMTWTHRLNLSVHFIWLYSMTAQ